MKDNIREIEGMIKGISVAQVCQQQALESFSQNIRGRLSNPEIDSIYNKLREVIDTNNQILNGFKQIKTILQVNTVYTPQVAQTITKNPQRISGSTYNHGLTQTEPNGPIAKLCRDYNSVIGDLSRKSEFTQNYNPIRFGTINAMERRRDPNINPVFQTATNGEYYAVAIATSSLYAVIPRFDLTFQSYVYGPGAMGIVFDCSGYDPNLSYRKLKLILPASFDHDRSKQQWTFKKKGVLDLGLGE